MLPFLAVHTYLIDKGADVVAEWLKRFDQFNRPERLDIATDAEGRFFHLHRITFSADRIWATIHATRMRPSPTTGLVMGDTVTLIQFLIVEGRRTRLQAYLLHDAAADYFTDFLKGIELDFDTKPIDPAAPNEAEPQTNAAPEPTLEKLIATLNLSGTDARLAYLAALTENERDVLRLWRDGLTAEKVGKRTTYSASRVYAKVGVWRDALGEDIVPHHHPKPESLKPRKSNRLDRLQ